MYAAGTYLGGTSAFGGQMGGAGTGMEKIWIQNLLALTDTS